MTLCFCSFNFSIKIYPVRLSTCNLHGKNNKAGISAMIPNINLRQFVLSIPISQGYDEHSDYWLEAGGVCLGPITVDATMALPDPQYHSIQDKFLKFHDQATHRLWFLWPPEAHSGDAQLTGTCGCIGNCRFFGRNRNGPTYFKPSKDDFCNSICTAVYHICVNEDNVGYGQSLLQPNKLIFTRIPGPLFLSTPTRNFLANQQAQASGQPLKPVSSDITKGIKDIGEGGDEGMLAGDKQPLTNDSGKPQDISETTAPVKRPEVLELREKFKRSKGAKPCEAVIDLEQIPLLVADQADQDYCSPTESALSAGSSVPSEYLLPSGSVPDTCYESETAGGDGGGVASATSASVSSLPDMVDFKNRRTSGHTRNSSYESPVKSLTPMLHKTKSPVANVIAQSSLQVNGILYYFVEIVVKFVFVEGNFWVSF